MIRQAAVRSVSYPDPPLNIDVSAFSLLVALGHAPLLDLQFAAAIGSEPRLKRMSARGRQTRLRHLVNELLGNCGAHTPILESHREAPALDLAGSFQFSPPQCRRIDRTANLD